MEWYHPLQLMHMENLSYAKSWHPLFLSEMHCLRHKQSHMNSLLVVFTLVVGNFENGSGDSHNRYGKR